MKAGEVRIGGWDNASLSGLILVSFQTFSQRDYVVAFAEEVEYVFISLYSGIIFGF